MEVHRNRVILKGPVLETQISIAKGHSRNATWKCSGKHMFLDIKNRINKQNNRKTVKKKGHEDRPS